MADNKQIAQRTLEAVGGKENVIQVAHCMTRLRFNLKDQSLPKDEEVKGIDGVLGVARSGGQYQIIIGQNVSKVYEEVRKIGGFGGEAAEEGQTETAPEKLTLKAVGSNALNYVSGSITPMIPVLMAAGMFKTMMAILGPDFLKVISAESHMYILLDFLYDAGFPVRSGSCRSVYRGVCVKRTDRFRRCGRFCGCRPGCGAVAVPCYDGDALRPDADDAEQFVYHRVHGWGLRFRSFRDLRNLWSCPGGVFAAER